MSRVSSRVMVRVAADVAFLAMRPVVEVFDFVFLPVMASDTIVPATVANVPVMAVMMALTIFDTMPGLALPPAFSLPLEAFPSPSGEERRGL